MSQEVRPGFYKDRYGRWQKDRRQGDDRRGKRGPSFEGNERRKLYRRLADREVIHDTEEAIEEALDDFAAEHGGHL